MKRVIIFSLAYLPYIGGAEIAIKEITDRLPEYEFDMVTLRFDGARPTREKIGNVTVHRVGFTSGNIKVSNRTLPWMVRIAKYLFPFTAFLKAHSLHREKKYDLVWAMMANQAGFAALFFKLWNPAVAYLLELQDGSSLQRVRQKRPITILIWPLYRAIYRYADTIKAISNYIKDLAREIGYCGRIEVIPNGVDVARFSAPITEDELVELKMKFRKRMGDIFVVTVARLVGAKRIEDVIHSLTHLPPHVRHLIVGEGEDRKKLEDIAKKIGVGDRVIFVGHVDHSQLPALLKISDIFVLPGLMEGFGNVFIEAFAAGVPIVATPVGGIPDFLTDAIRDPDMEPTGLFCNVRDPESIAAAVTRYMEDPVLLGRIVKNAKQLASEKYDWNIIAEAQDKLFAGLLSTRGITG